MYGHGMLDQAFDNPADKDAESDISTSTGFGQSFKPTKSKLSSVELRMICSSTQMVTVNIFSGNTISGTPFASTMGTVSTILDFQHFDFNPALNLTPESTYIINPTSSSTCKWDLVIKPPDYSRGTSFQNNSPLNIGDYLFRKFSFDSMPVGGEFIDVDTSAVLLAGALITSSWFIPITVSAIGIWFVLARKN